MQVYRDLTTQCHSEAKVLVDIIKDKEIMLDSGATKASCGKRRGNRGKKDNVGMETEVRFTH